MLLTNSCKDSDDGFDALKLPFEFKIPSGELPVAIEHPLFTNPVHPVGKVTLSDSVEMLVSIHQPNEGIPWSEVTGYLVFKDAIFYSIVLANDFSQNQSSSKLQTDFVLNIFETVQDPDTGEELADTLSLSLPRIIEQNLKAL